MSIANSLYFQVSRFDSDSKDVVYVGDAEPFFGSVNFNSVVFCCRVGQVLYKERVPLWDSNSRKLSDFVTRFSFIIDTQDFSPVYASTVMALLSFSLLLVSQLLLTQLLIF